MFLIFKKKKPKVDNRNEEIKKLRATIGIGEAFNYLGRTCIVTGHTEFLPYIGAYPRLSFDYLDSHGVIHSRSMSPVEFYSLINRQESSN